MSRIIPEDIQKQIGLLQHLVDSPSGRGQSIRRSTTMRVCVPFVMLKLTVITEVEVLIGQIGSTVSSTSSNGHRCRIFWYERYCFKICSLEWRRGQKGGSAKFKIKHTETFIPEYPSPVFCQWCQAEYWNILMNFLSK